LTLDIEGSTAAADANLVSNLQGIDRFAATCPEILREPIRAMLRQGAMAAWVFDAARSVRVTVRGYAPPSGKPLPPPPAAPRPPVTYVPPPKAPPKAKPKTTSTSSDFAFLHDAKLSIEEKLFRFMMAVQKRTDRELQDAMERYEKEFAKSKSSSSGSSTQAAKKDDGGGLLGFLGGVFDALGAVCPPLAIASSTLGELGLTRIATQLSGPLLASLCTAWGLPMLAPIALKLGPEVVQLALGEAQSSSSSSSSSSTSGTSSSEKTDVDERYELMKLQRLVEKQQQMFSLISNMLKVMHDTGMNAIHNIR
jgi:hypothetical protein